MDGYSSRICSKGEMETKTLWLGLANNTTHVFLITSVYDKGFGNDLQHLVTFNLVRVCRMYQNPLKDWQATRIKFAPLAPGRPAARWSHLSGFASARIDAQLYISIHLWFKLSSVWTYKVSILSTRMRGSLARNNQVCRSGVHHGNRPACSCRGPPSEILRTQLEQVMFFPIIRGGIVVASNLQPNLGQCLRFPRKDYAHRSQ